MAMNLEQVWAETVDRVKDKIVNITFWGALEAAKPIILDGDFFVVGMPPSDAHLGGHLRNSTYRSELERTIEEISGVHVLLRIIDGITREDWQRVKVREATQDRQKQQSEAVRKREKASDELWSELFERTQRMYASQPLRSLPQGRAIYLQKVLELTVETMDRIIPPDEPVDEINARNLARVIERIATNTDTPSTLIAHEFLKVRDRVHPGMPMEHEQRLT
ncbi:MAG: hypothetical protein ACYC1M_03790 [Armatimonadota bacterium]